MSATNSVLVELVGGPCDGQMTNVKARVDQIRVPNMNRTTVVYLGEGHTIPKTVWACEIYRQRMVDGEPAMSGGAYVMDYQGTE